MATSWQPKPDGDDFEPEGKFATWRPILQYIRSGPIPEEVKLRRVNHMKDEVFPFWHRLNEVRNSEGEELMAVYLKYNGPDGILKRYSQEYDGIKARIAATEDTILFKEMKRYISDDCSSRKYFSYGLRDSIVYNIQQTPESNSQRSESQSGQTNSIEHARAQPRPSMNLVPFGGIDGVPHHHMMNPDDDPSLKAPLLKILHRLMEHNDGKPFINFVDEIEILDYYQVIQRPRCLKFIERGLTAEDSVGYGVTAFFSDMRLLFWNCRLYNGPRSEYTTCSVNLEKLMRTLIGKMEGIGEKLLAQYDAVLSLDRESLPDPERIYLLPGFNPRLPGYEEEPDICTLRALAREQFQDGQERVRQLRNLLASEASGKGQRDDQLPVEGAPPADGGARKRTREEDADASGDDLHRGPKRQRSLRSPTPGPSNSGPVFPHRAAAKRIRASIDDDSDDVAEADKGHELRSSKRQRLTKDEAPSGVPSSSSGAAGSGSHTVPAAPATPKRNIAQVDDDIEGDDVDGGDDRGPSGLKRRRVMKDAPPTGLAVASTQAGPSTPRQATLDPRGPEPGSAQSHLTSPAGQPTPQPAQYPSHYGLPSSKPLKFSRNTITMSKIAKMGKRRPWLFGYKTAEGYGIYAFVSCPGANCKHHFSSHPLRDHRARDHILACNQPIRDDRDMIRQYARQVVKDADRKSDLTVDWARKSNLSLLPPNLKANHPENFPISPDDE